MGYGILKKRFRDIESAFKGYKPQELTRYGIFRPKINGIRDTRTLMDPPGCLVLDLVPRGPSTEISQFIQILLNSPSATA